MLPIIKKALASWVTGWANESNAGSGRQHHVNHPSCVCPACEHAIQLTNVRRAIVIAELAAIERGYDHA